MQTGHAGRPFNWVLCYVGVHNARDLVVRHKTDGNKLLNIASENTAMTIGFQVVMMRDVFAAMTIYNVGIGVASMRAARFI